MTVSRESILTTLSELEGVGITMSALSSALDVGKRDRERLRQTVDAMVDEGLVERIGRRYRIGKRIAEPDLGGPICTGVIHVHPAGYGFVERDDGLGDVFVPAKYRGTAMDGDTVRLYTWEGYRGTEGRVDEVLSRGRAKLTGIIMRSGRTVYLEPDDPRIATDHGRISLVKGSGEGAVGKAAVIEIVEYPTAAGGRIVGRISKVLGDPEDPNTEIEKIIACADIPVDFPEDVQAQAARTPEEVRPEDLADRIDLRDRPFLTIDPETARDFDDALCFEANGPHGGPRVWVAVADVSHYVQVGSPIDEEASIRGVSVYLPDRVIPMLPFQLSAGICSLNPEVDRCAMVVRLDYDRDARLQNTGFAAAVIRSHARLDYPGVAAALAGDLRGQRGRYRRWLPLLEGLAGLATRLRARRRARGTLELEISEAKVLLDADDPKLVRDVVRSKANPGEKEAYNLVEEFMIAANEAVGAYFERRRAATVWRVHAPPEPERLDELAHILSNFGVKVDVDAVQEPIGMGTLLEQLKGLPSERSLSFQVLRSLKQAVYDTENIGHFGLASDEYLHFTSPIRRYPDLLVHRLLKHHLHREGQASGTGGDIPPPPQRSELSEMARQCSSHERRAVEAEREAVALFRAYLMRDQVGEELSGTVSGVMSFGAFVEIDEPFVEGLIKVEDLGDETFEHDEQRMTLRGRKSGLVIGLGDRVSVEVVNVSIIKRKIDLRLLSIDEAAVHRPPTRPSKPPPREERGGRRDRTGRKAARAEGGRRRTKGSGENSGRSRKGGGKKGRRR